MHSGWQEDLPIFGRVMDILIVPPLYFPLLVVEPYKTIRLNSHLLSYLVKCTHGLRVLYVAQLENKIPLQGHVYLGDKQTYIALRSNIERLC